MAFHKQNINETAFNYCIQLSSVVDQKIDCSYCFNGSYFLHHTTLPLEEFTSSLQHSFSLLAFFDPRPLFCSILAKRSSLRRCGDEWVNHFGYSWGSYGYQGTVECDQVLVKAFWKLLVRTIQNNSATSTINNELRNE